LPPRVEHGAGAVAALPARLRRLCGVVMSLVRQVLSVVDQSEASLTVKRVAAQHFRAYSLTATNDVGRRRAVVELVRRRPGHAGGRRPPYPGERQAPVEQRPTPRQDTASALSRPDVDDHATGQ